MSQRPDPPSLPPSPADHIAKERQLTEEAAAAATHDHRPEGFRTAAAFDRG